MRDIIEGIIKDEILYEIIETVNENKRLLNEKNAEFEGRLKDIVDKYRRGLAPLNNTCEECQYRKNMLDSLK